MSDQQSDKISIIVPVRNTANYVGRCIDSLISQTYGNIEILLIDDGSWDESADILKQYEEKHPQIRFFRQEHRGAGAARNLGLKNAAGEYIMCCDSDDYYEPSMCGKMLNTLLEQGVDMVMCNMRMYEEDGSSHIPKEGGTYQFPMKSGKYDAGSPVHGAMNISPVNKIYKKSIIDKYGICFPENCQRSEDVAFVHCYMSVIENFYALYEPLYNHFEVEGSLMNKFEMEQIQLSDLLDKIHLLELFYDFLQKHNIFDKNRGYFIHRFKAEIFYSLQRLANNWEEPFFEKAGTLLRKVDLEDWQDDSFTFFAECLKHGDHERSLKCCFDYLLPNNSKTRMPYIRQDFLKPAFPENNVAVFFNCDDNYVHYLAVTLQSLIASSGGNYNYDLIILHENLSEDHKRLLRSLTGGAANFSLRFYQMGYYCRKYNISGFPVFTKHISTTAYYRMFAPLVFKNYERIVYLDSDLIVNADISELFFMPFEGKSLLAVVDYYINLAQSTGHDQAFRKYAAETLGMEDLSNYFNSGVLVLNLKKMRGKDYLSKFLEFGKINNYRYHDQNILNAALQNDTRLISPSWNFQSDAKLDSPQTIRYYRPFGQIKIIHFITAKKPWKLINLPYADIWWRHARNTPCYERLLYQMKPESCDGKENCSRQSREMFGGIRRLEETTARLHGSMNLNSLKLSFWRYRLLSKITVGKTKERYMRKKTNARNRIKEIQKFLAR